MRKLPAGKILYESLRTRTGKTTSLAVNTEGSKKGSCALVHIGMWIYFCFRKLIDTDDLSLPSHPMSITVQKVFPNTLEKPTRF